MQELQGRELKETDLKCSARLPILVNTRDLDMKSK